MTFEKIMVNNRSRHLKIDIQQDKISYNLLYFNSIHIYFNIKTKVLKFCYSYLK